MTEPYWCRSGNALLLVQATILPDQNKGYHAHVFNTYIGRFDSRSAAQRAILANIAQIKAGGQVASTPDRLL